MADDAFEPDYHRMAIPAVSVRDASGGLVGLSTLAKDRACLLILLEGASEPPIDITDMMAWLDDTPQLLVHPMVATTSRVPLLPPEAQALCLFDPTCEARDALGLDGTDVGAVLLGVDGLLAGGPVTGRHEVLAFAAEIRSALTSAFAPQGGFPDSPSDPASSIDLIIPFRAASPQRMRNLLFTVSYYRSHLPQARIILAEENNRTTLPIGTAVDEHLVVEGDPDLFNKSRLLNAAAALSHARYLVFADADCVPEVATLATLEGTLRSIGNSYLVPHSEVHYLTHRSSLDIIREGRVNDGSVDGLARHQMAVTVGGLTACAAESFAKIGGYDQQRFLGWGAEDDDLYNRFSVSEFGVWRTEYSVF
ncbi:galactosyltransferase-related protein [Propioniciclava sinopodophylli]|nr:galactosyltransferase-related protein [Propioniciclava sinopodophylli]